MNEVELSEGDDDLAGDRGRRFFAIGGFGDVGIGGFGLAVDEVELAEEGVDESVSVDADSIELPPGD